MGRLNSIEKIISLLQQATSREQIADQCSAFCQAMAFDKYFLYGGIFTSLVSHPTCVLDNMVRVRHKKQRIEKIVQEGINRSTPFITGRFPPGSPLNHPLLNPLPPLQRQEFSISFPVHYPMGRFALLHIVAKSPPGDCEQLILDGMVSGHRVAHEAGNAILRLLELELENSPPCLSAKEMECLLLATDGTSPQEIARQLEISTYSVVYYQKRAREKLHSRNLQGAISKAMLSGDIMVQLISEKGRSITGPGLS